MDRTRVVYTKFISEVCQPVVKGVLKIDSLLQGKIVQNVFG